MRKIVKWLLVIIASIIISGCPDGSPVVRFISGMEVELFNNGGGSDKLDVWNTDGETGSYGKEGIYGAGFGFVCRIEDNGIPLAGILIGCQIISHQDPLDIGWDIWDEYAPNGERYGYVRPLPNGDWDYDEGEATAYTNGAGECVFLIGLGDPNVGFGGNDDGYLWPDYDDGVSTLVEVRFIIRKASGNIMTDCYMAFFRSCYQNFWEPYEGIFGNSFSSLNQWNGWLKNSEKSGDVETNLGSVGEILFDDTELVKKTPYSAYSFDKSSGSSSGYTMVPDPNCEYILDSNCSLPDIANPIPDPNCPCYVIDPCCPDYPDPNCPWIPDYSCWVPDPNCYILDPNCPWIEGPSVPVPLFGEGWRYLDGTWRKWYPGYGWYLVNGIVATWISDIENPIEVMLAMDLSQPYVFLCMFEVDDIENVQAMVHTGMVVSKNDTGQKVSELPIELYIWDISANQVYLATNFILPMEFPEQQGEYYDRWGNSYTAIYVPEGGHLEVEADDFYGDFNFDGEVNHEDYGLFAVRWNENVFSPHDPNKAYDLMYDADYDGQTDMSDLIYFSDNWLETR